MKALIIAGAPFRWKVGLTGALTKFCIGKLKLVKVS